jgi:hypothetical protein
MQVYLPNTIDKKHLEAVKAQMLKDGAPVIRVVDCTDYYQAIEGSHRLTAAYELGIDPKFIVLDQDDIVNIDTLDLDFGSYDANIFDSYPQGDVDAWKVASHAYNTMTDVLEFIVG